MGHTCTQAGTPTVLLRTSRRQLHRLGCQLSGIRDQHPQHRFAQSKLYESEFFVNWLLGKVSDDNATGYNF